MNRRITQMKVAAGLAMVGVGVALATESLGSPPTMTEAAELDKLAGQPVDITPWAYEWRADMAVQKQPEAHFIPRRLDRMDKVYRTAFRELPQDQLKSLFYDSTPPLHSAQVAWAEIGRMGLMFPSSRCSSLHFTAGGIGAQRSAQSRHSPSDFLRNAK
jgi:hypothetical protein